MTEDKQAEVLRRIGARLDAIDAKLEQLTVKKPKKHAGPNGFDIGPIVATIPIIGGQYNVRQALLTELEAAYPSVDVPQTLKEIRVWCVANPTKRKTAKGVPRFINSWFAREQNR